MSLLPFLSPAFLLVPSLSSSAPSSIFFRTLPLFWLYKVEKELPAIQADVTARHKAEAAARGEIYVSPEEKARMEQEENDRRAEENRIKELKAKCAKKGLNFSEEEAKYQAKLAAKKIKMTKQSKK